MSCAIVKEKAQTQSMHQDIKEKKITLERNTPIFANSSASSLALIEFDYFMHDVNVPSQEIFLQAFIYISLFFHFASLFMSMYCFELYIRAVRRSLSPFHKEGRKEGSPVSFLFLFFWTVWFFTFPLILILFHSICFLLPLVVLFSFSK